MIPVSGRTPGVGNGSYSYKSPVFLPGELHGQSAWQATVHGIAESDTTEQLTHTHPHLGTRRLLKLRTQVRRQTWLYSLDSVIRAVCSTQTFEHFLCTRHCVGYLVI